MTTPPAGWYPDPNGTPYERYWDGAAWSDQLRSNAPQAPAPAPPPEPAAGSRGRRRIFVVGGVMAVVLVAVGVTAAVLSANRSADAKAHVTPDLAGMSPAEAQAALTKAGFTYTYKNIAPETPIALERWTVTGQQPVAGERSDDKAVALWASTPLMDAASKCDTERTADSGMTLTIDTGGNDIGSGDASFSSVECVLDILKAPSVVLSKMQETRALDGRQSDTWDEFEASWTYHPDQGLDVIIEIPR